MFKLSSKTRKIDSFFVMILFLLFAITAAVLVLIGVRQYQVTADSMNYNYEVRTATSYLREKIRQNDNSASICVESIDGVEVLSLSSMVNDTVYHTYIYYYDGYIREVLCAEDGGLLPEDGNEILAAKGLQISRDGDLISFLVTNEDGSESSLNIAVRSGGTENE